MGIQPYDYDRFVIVEGELTSLTLLHLCFFNHFTLNLHLFSFVLLEETFFVYVELKPFF
jgi:hypothetical protein